MTTIKAAVQAQFGEVAAHYRTSTVHSAGVDLDAIVEFVREVATPTVLDVGCGAGHVSAAVAPWSAAVVAADLTPAMLEQVQVLAAERGLTNITTREADVEQLPFADASFDLVLTRYSAHHWPHPTVALRECLRVIKPGGRLLLSDIVAPDAPALDTFLQTIELLRDRSHVRDHTVAQWQTIFTTVGATAELLLTWDVPLDFEAWVTRMATPAPSVALLRELFATASSEAQQAFAIAADDHFTLQGALLVAERPKAG